MKKKTKKRQKTQKKFGQSLPHKTQKTHRKRCQEDLVKKTQKTHKTQTSLKNLNEEKNKKKT